MRDFELLDLYMQLLENQYDENKKMLEMMEKESGNVTAFFIRKQLIKEMSDNLTIREQLICKYNNLISGITLEA